MGERKDDIKNIMASLDISCSSSNAEGFPNVIVKGCHAVYPV